jgi:urease accessory protein
LVERTHHGPLLVQKPFYPEGDGCCHAILVHPPGGICGGDELHIAAQLETGAKALITTPGATKWYRSGGVPARQLIAFDLFDQAIIEWLPQETIAFAGCEAQQSLRVELGRGAAFTGLEVIALGRTAAGERFDHGSFNTQVEIRRDRRLLWFERSELSAESGILHSVVGLAGHNNFGQLVFVHEQVGEALVEACRRAAPVGELRAAVTHMPEVLLARCLAPSARLARQWLITIWQAVRHHMYGATAHTPRIWAT